MAEPRSIITYSDFSGGEFGSLGAWAAPRDSFTGLNVLRYPDGSIGPRAGLNPYTLTGMPAGDVLMLGNGKTSAGSLRVWFVKGTTVYAFNPTTGGAVTAYTGALTSAPANTKALAQVNLNAKTYWLNPADGRLYKIDHDAATVTSITTLITGTAGAQAVLCQYGEFTMAASSEGRRIYYSAAANPESWPAANFFDVGTADKGVFAMYAQRQSLTIVKAHQFFVGEWWVLTGVPGVDDVLRPMQEASTPTAQDGGALTGEGDIAFVASNESNAPGVWTGADVVLRPELRAATSGTLYNKTTALWYPGDWLHLGVTADNGPAKALLHREAAWTKHRFEVGPSGYSLAKAHAVTFPGSDLTVLCTDGRTTFYKWSAYPDNPRGGLHGRMFEPASASDCTFTLPEWWSQDGSEVQISQVIVDFQEFTGGVPAFTVAVTPLRTYNGVAGTTVSEAYTASSPVSDTVRRKTMTYFPDATSGFQVTISNLRSVAIQKVTVIATPLPRLGD